MADPRLASFLLQLMLDDTKRGQFDNMSDADKRKWMSKLGLTTKQQDALLSGDLVKILEELNQQYGSKPGDFMMPP